MPLLFNGGLRLLTVLGLRGASLETFPDEVLKLFHLRYLSLRGTQVKVIPNSIEKLQNLETFDLKHTYVTELPIEILRLQQLRHLLVYRFETEDLPNSLFHEYIDGFKAPSKIGDLQSLHSLSLIGANHVSDNAILKEIGRLTQLRTLGIIKLRREDGATLCSSIEKLSNLCSLYISSTEEDEIIDLQSLSPVPQCLQQPYLEGHLEELPHWITSLYGLHVINLAWSKLRDDPLQSLQDLPNLVRLVLTHAAYEGEGLCFKVGKFQSLKYLKLKRLKGLRWVTIEEASMPRLEELLIQDCKLVEELPFDIEHLSNLKHLDLTELISKSNPSIEGGDFHKIAHIPTLWIGHSKEGHWEEYYH